MASKVSSRDGLARTRRRATGVAKKTDLSNLVITKIPYQHARPVKWQEDGERSRRARMGRQDHLYLTHRTNRGSHIQAGGGMGGGSGVGVCVGCVSVEDVCVSGGVSEERWREAQYVFVRTTCLVFQFLVPAFLHKFCNPPTGTRNNLHDAGSRR